MRGKLVICHVICVAVGCLAGALAAAAMGEWGAAVLAVAVAGILDGVCVTKVMSEDAQAAAKGMAAMATARLTQVARVARSSTTDDDEQVDFLKISERLAFASQQVLWGIHNFQAALGKLAKISDSISSRAESNAGNLQKASDGIAEIAEVAGEISAESETSVERCNASVAEVERHRKGISEVSLAIKDVGSVVNVAVDEINGLNKASEKIANFVGKIRGIASQTNLLSLNAAIEAARAGEHGKGFAVVAEEVRQSNTTGEMAKVIEHIGQTTTGIADNTRETSDSVGYQTENMGRLTEYANSLLVIAENLQEAAVAFKKPNEIIFAVNPFTDPAKIRETYVPILNEVASEIGYKARTIIVNDYQALGEALNKGLADVGWFSPAAYVTAKKEFDVVPLVTPKVNNATSYTGYIIVNKDSGIKSLSGLAGKSFAFVDKKSASGYVYPRAALLESGKNPETFFSRVGFLGSHNKVIDAVLSGEVQGGATYSEAFEAAGSRAANHLDIIFKTDPIPKDAIAATPSLPQELVQALVSAFEAVNENNIVCGRAMGVAHINGFVRAKDEDYDVVRKALSR